VSVKGASPSVDAHSRSTRGGGGRVAVIVNGPPGSGKSTLAGPLARRLSLPLLAKDAVKETLLDQLGFADRAESRRIGAASGEVLWTVLSGCPDGAVLESWLGPHLREVVTEGLARAAVDRFVEVWCRCPPDVARRRYAARVRHPGHYDELLLPELDRVLATAEPLALGPVVEVATDRPVDLDGLVHRLQGQLTAGSRAT
jgi:predicted kinase